MFALILALPFLLVIVMFALSNQQTVQITLWPTDFQIEMPLSLAALALAFVFFLVGALMAWGGTLAARSRARRAEAQVRQLRGQVEALQARPAMAGLPPPGA